MKSNGSVTQITTGRSKLRAVSRGKREEFANLRFKQGKMQTEALLRSSTDVVDMLI